MQYHVIPVLDFTYISPIVINPISWTSTWATVHLLDISSTEIDSGIPGMDVVLFLNKTPESNLSWRKISRSFVYPRALTHAHSHTLTHVCRKWNNFVGSQFDGSGENVRQIEHFLQFSHVMLHPTLLWRHKKKMILIWSEFETEIINLPRSISILLLLINFAFFITIICYNYEVYLWIKF